MLPLLCAALQTQFATPLVDLNHFYITVDHVTFQAFKSSKWLKETFADVEVQTNTSGKETWTGLYVYGVGSYVEIFEATEDFKEGEGGIGLLTSMPGGVDNVYANMLKSPLGKRAERDLMNLGSKANQTPFAHIASYSGQEPTNLSIWLMEYHAEHFARARQPVGASQSKLFASWRAKKKLEYNGLMSDLRGVTVRPKGDGEDLRNALIVFGFGPTESLEGWVRGANEIVVGPVGNQNGQYAVQSARFSLRVKPKRTHVERFGKRSRLTVSTDGTAEWKFD